jgi:putative endonuclease
MSSTCDILYSSKLDKYYIGSTIDMERRLFEHNRGKEKFTKMGIPWVIVCTEIFVDLKQARTREHSIKKQKSRKYIEALIGSAE